MSEFKKPKVSIEAQKELDKAEKQFDEFDKQVKDLTLDRMKAAPKFEQEEQTKLSAKEIEKSKEIYLKPKKSIGSREPFNEKWREEYNFKKEYVHFIAENHEIIGESLDLWTKPFPGMPAEEWIVPVNTPVWGPRYLAEQIKGCQYHRLKMERTVNSTNSVGEFYGSMAVDTTVQRLDARPVSQRKSVFTGASGF